MTALLRFLAYSTRPCGSGAAVFLFIGLPAIFTDEFKTLIGPGGPVVVGWAAERILARFFILQYCCAAFGLAHLTLEWLYCGKPLVQRNLGILALLFGLALAGGLWMQPKLKDLHTEMYYGKTQAARDGAGSAFKAWHAVSECGNVLVVGGLVIYLWRVSRSGEHARFESLNLDKIRA